MLRRERFHVQTPAVLMIIWCRAVELASYPLGCQKGCSTTYDPYSYENVIADTSVLRERVF